jgi:hypothetical protein
MATIRTFTYPSVSLSSGPVQYVLDGVVTTVNKDTVTPTNSRALPVELMGTAGPINITAGDLNVQLTDQGANPDRTRIGDGTNQLGITASSEAKTHDADALVALLSIDTKLTSPVAVTGPLTDTQLRATAVPVSGPLTDTELRATAVPVSGPLTDVQLRATAVPVSGPLTDTQLRATAVPVSGPLTDTQLRATAVPVSGTVTATGPLTDAELRAAAVPVSGPLTDTELRATAVPVSGPLTDTELRATAVPVSGPLTDTQLRATAVPVSGPLTDTQLRATAVPVSAASLPLPTGAATETTLNAFSAKSMSAMINNPFDEVVVTYVGATTRIDTVVYKLATVTVNTLTLSYDGSDRLDGVVKT